MPILPSEAMLGVNVGARMFQNTQEMLLRRKLEEQAELQQAIELHGRRLMNMQLLDLKNHNNHQYVHGLSTGSPIPSPTLSRTTNSQNLIFPPDDIDQEVPQGWLTIILTIVDLKFYNVQENEIYYS